jgi:hypothetical protein
MRVQANINIDLDTLSDEIDERARQIRSAELRTITYQRVLPRFLELLDRHQVKATFFVIGRDAVGHQPILKAIADAGHELANHTMNHPKQLVRLTPQQIAREITECGDVLRAISGVSPVGFRAPGYTISPEVIAALRAAGYTYDTSLNASWVYLSLKRVFKAVRLSDKEFIISQPFADTVGPRNPYRVSSKLTQPDAASEFLEIPVSVVPYVHYPFVTSVLLQIGSPFTLWCLRRLVEWKRFVNCNLHINEFTDRSDLDGVAGSFYFTEQYAKIDLRRRMHYFDLLVDEMKRRCEMVLLRDVKA